MLLNDEARQRLAGVEESEQAIHRLVVVPYLAEHMEVLPRIPAEQKALDEFIDRHVVRGFHGAADRRVTVPQFRTHA